MHGFDEFFGNLYHLNAEEEPENPDYPKDPKFRKRFGPAAFSSQGSESDDQRRTARQATIENTGPLDTKRMETIDEEFLAAAKDFINRQQEASKTVVLLFQSNADAHLHSSKEGVARQDRPGHLSRRDGRDDGHVGELLKLIDDLGVADNTIVVYTTDNGAEGNDLAGRRRNAIQGRESDQLGGRLPRPCLIRWPGVIKPGTIVNDICAHEDFIPTFAAAAGDPDLVDKLLTGARWNGKNFKVHLDGENLLPFFKGEAKNRRAKSFFYWSDDGDLMAIRYRRLEGDFPRTEHGDIAENSTGRLVRAVYRSPCAPKILQPTLRSIRARTGKHQLRRLVRASHVHPYAGADLGRHAARELQGVSAARQGQRASPVSDAIGEDHVGGEPEQVNSAIQRPPCWPAAVAAQPTPGPRPACAAVGSRAVHLSIRQPHLGRVRYWNDDFWCVSHGHFEHLGRKRNVHTPSRRRMHYLLRRSRTGTIETRSWKMAGLCGRRSGTIRKKSRKCARVRAHATR